MRHYLPYQCCPDGRLLCGGQPSEAQLADFAAANPHGCVINLRPVAETAGWDEGTVVRRLGLAYVHIPVAGPQDLTQTNARALAIALDAHAGVPLLIHCASGQRIAALLALKAVWVDGQSRRQAMATGKSAGLSALEPYVEAQLSGH